jgi:Mn2+/Fe2+ NRAMP family transporter
LLGPGLVAAASDDGPSGIDLLASWRATGVAVGWTMLFSYPLMAAIQEISGRIGRTTGRGIAGNLREYYPNWLPQLVVLLIFTANTSNIGADLGAMGDAAGLLIGGPHLAYVALFGIFCAGLQLQVIMRYTRYVSVLKWLTLALFAYLGP